MKLFINLPYTRCLKCGRFFFGKEILTKVNNRQKIKFLNFGTSIFKIYDDKKMEELQMKTESSEKLRETLLNIKIIKHEE